MEKTTGNRMSIKNMALAGMFAAFLAVMSQISLPMPSGVPVTVQVFAVVLTGCILGWRLSLTTVIVYILIGAVGVPVFSNFRGGLSVLTGVTGGYIMAWPLLAALSGVRIRLNQAWKNQAVSMALALLGLCVVESIGAIQWALLSGNDIRGIMFYSLAAFVPKDIILTVLAVAIGGRIRQMAVKAGVL